jgi:hypothetical protein
MKCQYNFNEWDTGHQTEDTTGKTMDIDMRTCSKCNYEQFRVTGTNQIFDKNGWIVF